MIDLLDRDPDPVIRAFVRAVPGHWDTLEGASVYDEVQRLLDERGLYGGAAHLAMDRLAAEVGRQLQCGAAWSEHQRSGLMFRLSAGERVVEVLGRTPGGGLPAALVAYHALLGERADVELTALAATVLSVAPWEVRVY